VPQLVSICFQSEIKANFRKSIQKYPILPYYGSIRKFDLVLQK